MQARRFLETLFFLALISLPFLLYAARAGYLPALAGVTGAVAASYETSLPSVEENLIERRILFVGNSYTRLNALPQMIPWIAASVPYQKYRYVVETAIVDGRKMFEHLGDPRTAALLGGGTFDAVVLQEQSTVFLYTNEAMTSFQAFLQAVPLAQRAGTKAFIFGTWPRRAGDEMYGSKIYSNFTPPSGPADMMRRLHHRFTAIEKSTGATYVPVGLYWYGAAPYIELYMDDGSHPNLAGGYLSAILLYSAISGHPTLDIKWAPAGLDAGEAGKLRMLANSKLWRD